MIKIKNLKRCWGKFSLKDINLQIEKGDYFIILGPTGGGKTLFLKTIAGIYFPDEGNIFIDEKDVTFLPPEKREIAFVYQGFSLFPHLSVMDNIKFGLKYKKIFDIEKKINFLVDVLEIKSILERKDPLTLSGGESHRVAIARALILEPKILLLDEPFGQLDEMTREKLQKQILEIHKNLGITILHVTHNRLETKILGNKIAILRDGEIIQTGKMEDVFLKPNSKFVAEFLGVKNA